MCGQEGYYGTGSFNVLLDIDKFKNIDNNIVKEDEKINDLVYEPYKECNHIVIENNINNIKSKDWGNDGDDYMPDGL